MGLFDIFSKNTSEDKNGNEEVVEETVAEKNGNVIEEDIHNVAKDMLTEILDLMGFFNVVKVLEHEADFVSLEVKGDDLGRIIGKEGNTLFALQVILKNILTRKYKRSITVQIDANNYRDKRSITIKNMALDAADKAYNENTEVTLQAMNAWERRVVHMTLQDNDKVKTESFGRDKERKVIISPK